MAELREIKDDIRDDEQKEKDAENFLRVFIWVVGVITAFILFVCMMVEFDESSPDTEDWLPLLIFFVVDIVGMIVNLSVLRIASGIARNLREINRKLK